MYKAEIPVAIESAAGLTDAVIARQPLERRGRPGHEKQPTPEYLIGERKAHFTLSVAAQHFLGLRGTIPNITIDFGDGVVGNVLHWDPDMMAALAERGVVVPDFLGMIDAYVRGIDTKSREEVERDFTLLRRFYFDHVDDPAREEPFVRRLGWSTR